MTTVALSNPFLMLFDPPQDPLVAMDRDRELLAKYGTGVQSVIRFYSWNQPAISLGTIQDTSVIDFQRARYDNVVVTVRPTGGRHVFHDDDVCFSIIVPPSQELFWGKTVVERQQKVGELLSQLLQTLGVSPDIRLSEISTEAIRSSQKSPCFSLPVHYEPTILSRKIAGIAQLITNYGGLIQGAIPRTDRYLDIVKYESFALEEQVVRRRQLVDASCSLERVLDGRCIGYDEVVQRFSEVVLKLQNL